MPDQTARDAVKRGLLDAFRGAWTDSEYEATFGPAADAVLAVLGIPPDTTTDEVRAGLALLGMFAAGWRIQPDTAADGSRDWCALLDRWDGQDWDTLHDATGASPAAAVLALAAKLKDDR